MRSGTLCRCGRQHRLVSLAEAPGNPRGRSKRPRELAVDRGTIAEVDQGGARRSRAERQSAGACPQTRLRESYVRFGFRIGDREWGSGWLVTLAVFAIAIGVFFLIALPAWLRDDPVWKSLEGVTSISLASRGAACAVHGNGAVACWGSFREDGPPDRTFVSVSAAQHHACGVTTDRFVVCWRSDGRPWGEPQGERFVSVSSGLDYACGVTSDGSLRCWGAAGFGHGAVPDGKFTAVSIGDYHSCGIRADGSVACWGANDRGQAAPPEGAFSSLSAGPLYTCGIRVDQSVECWGANDAGQTTPPAESFSSITAGRKYACGVRPDHSVACWGLNAQGRATPPPGQFTEVSAGSNQACGITTSATVVCWGPGR